MRCIELAATPRLLPANVRRRVPAPSRSGRPVSVTDAAGETVDEKAATADAKGPAGTAAAAQAGAAQIGGTEWLRRFSDALGMPAPSEEEIDALLGLAGIAAHASERTAAPLSTWLVGRAGVQPAVAKELAARLATMLSAQDEG